LLIKAKSNQFQRGEKMANIRDFKMAKEVPISYKTFRILFRIGTTNKRQFRWYNDVVKYPAYKISDMEEHDKKSREQYINQAIERTTKYCDTTNEKVICWSILG
jgi:hypothetical protein